MALGGWTAARQVGVTSTLGHAVSAMGSTRGKRESSCCAQRNRDCYMACALNPNCRDVSFDCEGRGKNCTSVCALDLGPEDPRFPEETETPW